MIELLLSILTQFGLYGLLALSLALVFGVSRVVNLAVGDFATIGAFVALATSGLPFALRLLVALIIAAPLLYVIQRGLLAPVLDSPLATLLITWGVGMLIRQTCEVVFGSTPRSVPAPVEGSIPLGEGAYPTYRLVAAAVSVAVIVAVLLVVHGTRTGLRIRAVSDNPVMASLLGTHPSRTRTAVFVLAGLLAVTAGVLYSPLLGVYPSLGMNILTPAFVALLLAAPGSFRGAVAGAAAVVTVQILLRRVLPDTAAEAVFYALVLIVIGLRSVPFVRKALTWTTTRTRAARSA